MGTVGSLDLPAGRHGLTAGRHGLAAGTPGLGLSAGRKPEPRRPHLVGRTPGPVGRKVLGCRLRTKGQQDVS